MTRPSMEEIAEGETLFIDARQLGTMETRVLKVFTDEDIAKIAETVQSWKTGKGYEDVAGFCKSASLEEIRKKWICPDAWEDMLALAIS